MQTKDFFDFYFSAIEPEILARYRTLLPLSVDLAADCSQVMERGGYSSLNFLLDFYALERQLLMEKPDQAILFNVADNVCFDYFTAAVLGTLDRDKLTIIEQKTGQSDAKSIVAVFKRDLKLRNWFRQELGSRIKENQLFRLNEVIALQNFSSGGEYSFLKYAYSYLQNMEGPMLDAGCGTGFAALVMSRKMPVIGIDASRIRLARARAMQEALAMGDIAIVNSLMKLIQLELGDLSVNGSFPSGASLLAGKAFPLSVQEGRLDNLLFADDFFGCINCLDVLEHTSDPDSIIHELARVCRPGGCLLITVPTLCGALQQRIYENIEGTMFPAMLHLHHFDRRLLESTLGAHGFQARCITEFDYVDEEQIRNIAALSPEADSITELGKSGWQREALQIFAVFERT